MKRSESPAFLESVANHPRVLRAIGCTGEQFTAGDSWADSIGLEWDEGGIVFHRTAPGIYSAHLVFLPKTQGIAAKCADALRYMFTRTGARVITGTIPLRLRHARAVAKAAHMRHLFDCDGKAHYRLTVQDWRKHKERNDGLG